LLSLPPLNVALISDAVAQAQQVRAAATTGTIAIVYHSNTMTTPGLVDLLAAVSAAHGGAPIGNLAIMAHGGPAEIDLGNTDDLSLATLPGQASALGGLRFVLTSNACVDLFTCCAAVGASGKTFVADLAAATGANVFASDSLVGTVPGATLFLDCHSGPVAATTDLFSLPEMDVIPRLRLGGLFVDGDYVESKSSIGAVVRAVPGGTTVVTTEAQGSRGTVVSTAPVYASYNGTYYYWNQVNWNDGYSGWTADLGLGLAFGQPVGSFNGVTAYSNGYTTFDSYTNNSTGLEYQCCEYVNRYYSSVYQINYLTGAGNAINYFSYGSAHGLTAYTNGDTTSAPQVGDILCFGGTGDEANGHVAIVCGGDGSSEVDMIEQNGTEDRRDANFALSMTVSDGIYTVSAGNLYQNGANGTLYVQGWLRKAMADTTPPTVSAFSVTPTSVSVGSPITISYTASDTSGSGLETAQLWRAPDDGYGVPGTWQQVGSSVNISAAGNGPYQGSFSDTPPLAGQWWYGVHITNGAGNWNDEQNSQSNGSPDLGPIQVTVVVGPVLNVSPTSLTLPTTTEGMAGSTISFTVSGSGLGNGDTLTLWAPTGSEISQDDLSFYNTFILYPTSGDLPSTTVYVQTSASATANVSGYLTVQDALHSSLDQLIPVNGTVQPVYQPPIIGSLSKSPDPVTQGSDLTLTANNVDDSDGTVVNVEFYCESNGQSGLQTGSGGDTFLGYGTQSGSNWSWDGSTNSFVLGANTYYAIAQNNDGDWSNSVSTTGTVTGSPEIAVEGWYEGVAQNIFDDEGNPIWGDGTYFGTVAQNAAPPTRTYTVQNTGTAPLTVGTPTVPLGFTIIEPLNGPIAPGGSANFTVQMSTSTVGTPSGNISFSNNDGAETPFSFAISGTVTYAGATATTTVLNVSPSSAVYGQPVTLTAAVGVITPGSGTPTGGTVIFMAGTTLLGSTTLNNGSAVLTTTSLPAGLQSVTAVYSGDGSNFASSSSSIGSNLIISTVAGGGSGGNGGLATAASLSLPCGIAVDSSGDLFIADTSDDVVREVKHSTGIITTVAGNGTAGYNGDNIQATMAELNVPYGVAVDANGQFLFIADGANMRIREVNLSTGIITTVAGNGTYGPPLGDNGPATAASLCVPKGIAVDNLGNLFIADTQDNRIREVNLTGGTEVIDGINVSAGGITTVAGGGTGSLGDGGLATEASLAGPTGVTVDASGNLFIADTQDNRIREVNYSTHIITTVAGNGIAGSGGDGGAATAASLNSPWGVAVETSGHLFISDCYNFRIREVNLSTDTITTIAGGSYNFGDNGPALAASVSYPSQLAVDSSGNLFVADDGHNRIREITAGNLSVNIIPATLTVTANDQTMVYGAALPTLTASYSGFVNGDTPASLTAQPTLSTTATADSAVSDDPYGITANGAIDSDYTISYVPGTLTVTAAPLTIAANGTSKTYGQTLSFAGTEFAASGLVDGNSVTSVALASAGAVASAAPGTYTIMPSAAVGSGLNNYSILYVPGTLTVTPTTLTVTTADWTSEGLTLMLGSDGNLHTFITGTTTNAVTPCPPASITEMGITAPSSTSANLTIDSTAGDPIPAGGLNYSGAGGLIKAGSGSVILSGTDTYTGGTTVVAGTLLINSTNAFPNGGSLTIGAGGTFIFDPSSSASSIDTTTVSNDTTGAASGGTRVTTGVPSYKSQALSSLVLLASTEADAAASSSVATPASASVFNSAGNVLVQSSATAVTSPVASPLLASSLGPQTKNLSKAFLVGALGTSAVNRVVWSSPVKEFAAHLAWLGQPANSSDNSDQQRKKDVTILALDAVFAQYGQ